MGTALPHFVKTTLPDSSDAINSLNGFPEDPLMHTFLLNSDNRVITFGNPVKSKVPSIFIFR